MVDYQHGKRQIYPLAQAYLATVENGDFTGELEPRYFVDANYVLSKLNDPASLTIDARSAERFLALIPEPRPAYEVVISRIHAICPLLT